MTKINYPIAGYAPGFYVCKCSGCSEEFMGDKRATQCEPCAINYVTDQLKIKSLELHKLKSSLERIQFSNTTINEVLNNNK